MPGTWTQKTDFGGVSRYWDIGFNIGSKGYIGCGWNTSTYYRDFWEYNPDSNTWTQKADYGGSTIVGGVGFSIGSYGYVGTGSSGGGNRLKEFYRYDPSSNSWTLRTPFGGTARYDATGFGIGTKGYIGTGWSIVAPTFNVDFWEYNPSTNAWTQKANHPGRWGAGLSSCSGFSIGTKGYIGWGRTQMGQLTNKVYEYDPSTNNWTQKASVGPSGGTKDAVGFSIGSKGYFGTGSYASRFYEYNPSTNNWTQKANFGGAGRSLAAGFGIGTKGYIGTGSTGFPTSTKDFWEWEPSPSEHIISGNVKDSSGNNLSNVTISFENSISYETSTDVDGNYSQIVSPDVYTVTASKDKYLDSSTSVDATTSNQTQNFVLSKPVISGNIKDNKGYNINGVIIVFTDDTPYETTTDSDGNYSQEVDTGEYTVVASLAGYTSSSADVNATAGDQTQDFILDRTTAPHDKGIYLGDRYLINDLRP